MAILPSEIRHRLEYHAPTPAKRELHEIVREKFIDLSTEVLTITPEGREQSLAITKLEEAMFWVNAGIARASDKTINRIIDIENEDEVR